MAEHLDTILRLVADGRLSAEDAEPLLAALSDRPSAASPPRPTPAAAGASDPDEETSEWPTFLRPPEPRGSVQPLPRPPPLPATPPLPEAPRPPDPPRAASNARRQLRIEVIEGGRRVVNLRIPLGLAGVATSLVPGLSAEHGERIREAIRSGSVGPILEVEGDDGDRVVIATE